MTKLEAKELTLEVWRYLAEHPEIVFKINLPEYLFEKIQNIRNWCPLCEFHHHNCVFCPLKNCFSDNSLWHQWFVADTDKDRKNVAQKIVETIEAWNPE